MEPAPQATAVGCAEVSVRLPDSVGDLPRRETNAQGTGAWGADAAVLLHCGVDPLAPTTNPCVTINGVDWVEDDSEAPYYRFTTYGREPAVEVYLDSAAVSGSTVLVDLGTAVSVIPQTRHCVGVQDLEVPSS